MMATNRKVENSSQVPTQSDFSEGDIWHYQPTVRKTGRSRARLSISSQISDDRANLKCSASQTKPSAVAICRKRKEVSHVGRVAHQPGDSVMTDRCTSSEEQSHIIDVDLESDFEFPTSTVTTLSQSLHKAGGSRTQVAKSASKHPSQLVLSDPLSSQILPCAPQSQRASKKGSKHARRDSETKSSPSRKSQRSSQSKAMPVDTEAPSTITKYFSPKKSDSKASMFVKNSYPKKIMIDLSVDDFDISEPEPNVRDDRVGHQLIRSVVANLDTQKPSPKQKQQVTNDNCDTIKHNSTFSVSDEVSELSVESVQNGREDVKKNTDCKSTLTINVDVIHDEESEHSSLESKNHSTSPLTKSSPLVLEPCVAENNGECSRKVRFLSGSKMAEKEGNIADLKSQPPLGWQSKDAVDCMSEQTGGFLVDSDSSDSDELFRGENNMSQKRKSFTKQTTPSNYEPVHATGDTDVKHSTKYDQFTVIKTNEIAQSESCIAKSGGFLSNTTTFERDHLSEEGGKEGIPAKFNTKPGDTAEKVDKTPYSLTSSASWPSKSTKQATLLSFLKVKPSSGAPSFGSTTQGPSLSKSGSVGTTFPQGRKDGSNRPSSSNLSRSRFSSSSMESTDSYNENFQGKKRQCPFYKKIPGTSITVDAFRYGVIPGCEAYVLTHFHYDHYGGLTKKFSQPMFCSQVTGNLVESRIGVEKKYINCLPMWMPCNVAGTRLTLMEANHCPGAVIILFELKDGRKILHTGDFRANKEMEFYTALQGIKIAELYLDTTYCNPSYAFPDQSEVVHFVVNLVLNHITDHPSTLIVCGAYTIGKERIFTAIAKALDSKICVMSDKKKVLDCLEDADLKSRVTLDWSAGRVHVLPMGKLNLQHLREHLARHSHFERVLAFQPTGWTHSDKQADLHNLKPKWSSRDGITLYGVPYSEHSSFEELKRFVQHFRPQKILPTVNNGNPTARSKMEAIFREWMR